MKTITNNNIKTTQKTEIEQKMRALAPDQLEQLRQLLHTVKASRAGSATERDILNDITNLPASDVEAFNSIFQTFAE